MVAPVGGAFESFTPTRPVSPHRRSITETSCGYPKVYICDYSCDNAGVNSCQAVVHLLHFRSRIATYSYMVNLRLDPSLSGPLQDGFGYRLCMCQSC